MGQTSPFSRATQGLNTQIQDRLPVRAVVLCCDGLFQRYLIARVAEEMILVGLVFQRESEQCRRPVSRYRKLLRPVSLIRHLLGRWVMYKERLSCSDMYEPIKSRIRQVPIECPELIVANVNDARTDGFLAEVRPDVVLVNGTKLIRAPLLDQARHLPLGMINLHTGLSPYSRGGNCNLHMLREGKPELVGVTVHHIDSGIDSGDLILTARPKLETSDTFERIEAKVFLLGIERVLKAVQLLYSGTAPRVSQWTQGKLFLKRTGYDYSPWYRFEVRRKLRFGLIHNYLAERTSRDHDVRLIGEESFS